MAELFYLLAITLEARVMFVWAVDCDMIELTIDFVDQCNKIDSQVIYIPISSSQLQVL